MKNDEAQANPCPHRQRCRFFLKWHRTLGIIAAGFIVLVAVTGILLNHNAALGLQQQEITHPWLLDHYDINAVSDDAFSYPETLTLDRVILDLHTGRFFGTAGRIIMDLAAVAMLLLAFTGIRLWRLRSKKP